MVTSDSQHRNGTNRETDYQRQTPFFQRKGIEKKVSDKLESLIKDIVCNIRQIPWVTNAEFNGDKIIYHIKKGGKAKGGCRTIRDYFSFIVKRDFGPREDLAVELNYRIENERKGIYSVSLEIEADNPEKALYEIASKLNAKLENYLNSLK